MQAESTHAAESGWAAANKATRIKKKKRNTPTHTNDFALISQGKGRGGMLPL
jgi:hypothetical protein